MWVLRWLFYGVVIWNIGGGVDGGDRSFGGWFRDGNGRVCDEDKRKEMVVVMVLFGGCFFCYGGEEDDIWLLWWKWRL